MHTHNERGIALILALLLTSAMSALAVSLMFLSQTETYASMNYRMMSQARYAGEAAIQKAGSFLLDATQYAPPGTTNPADVLASYNRNVSPVTLVSNGQPVVLSAVASVASNYPVAAVSTAFGTTATGELSIGNGKLTYGAYATLMSMSSFDTYGGGTTSVVQTWKVTGVGGLVGPRNATVQVEALLETPRIPGNLYAAFATGNACGSMYFHGNVTVNSYDSANVAAGATPTFQNYGGNVGTNGNLQIDGSVDVKGNLSTPRTGVGTCTAGAVTALSETGSATVEGSNVHLPAPVSFPSPEFTMTPPRTTVNIDATLWDAVAHPAGPCAALNLTVGVNCAADSTAKTITVTPNTALGTEVAMPGVIVGGGYKLIVVGHATPAATVNINSIGGSGQLQIQANTTGANNESVVLKVQGLNADGTEMAAPIDLSTMSWKQNSASYGFDASTFQIAYGGSGTIAMTGNAQSAAVVYAPNANFQLNGTTDLFGSVLAKSITNGGNASIHYDRRLQRDFFVKGHPMASTFSWQRY